MDFDDLRTDIDLECPHCNRKFQQDEEREADVAECPGCGGAVDVKAKPSGEKQ